LPQKRKEFNEIIQDLLDKAAEKEKEELAKNPIAIVENGAQAIKEQQKTSNDTKPKTKETVKKPWHESPKDTSKKEPEVKAQKENIVPVKVNETANKTPEQPVTNDIDDEDIDEI